MHQSGSPAVTGPLLSRPPAAGAAGTAAGLLVLLALSGNSSGASPAAESPNLKGIYVTISGPSQRVKARALVHYSVDVSTNRQIGPRNVRIRVFLPGVRIIKMQLAVAPEFHLKTRIRKVKGGVYITFSRIPSGFSFPAELSTRVVLPRGRKFCDRVVVTITGGKSGTYKHPTWCYRVS